MIILENSAIYGGALYSSDEGTVMIYNSQFIDNVAQVASSIFINDAVNFTGVGLIFEGNYALAHTVFRFSAESFFTISDSSFLGNSAYFRNSVG